MARAHARSSAPPAAPAGPNTTAAVPAARPRSAVRAAVWCGLGWAVGWVLAGSAWAGVDGPRASPEPIGSALAPEPSLPQLMPAGGPAAVVGGLPPGAAQPLELRMAWRPLGEAARGLAWGVGVVAPASTGAAGGPWAAQRAAETSALPAEPALGQAPARAVLGVGRAFPSGLSLHMDLSARLPGQAPGRGVAAGLAPGDAALADEAGGQWRVGLAFRGRPAGEALRQGLSLKMSLGGATVLAVKPRARRVTLQLSSQW